MWKEEEDGEGGLERAMEEVNMIRLYYMHV
jgi:hypothetical protein